MDKFARYSLLAEILIEFSIRRNISLFKSLEIDKIVKIFHDVIDFKTGGN